MPVYPVDVQVNHGHRSRRHTADHAGWLSAMRRARFAEQGGEFVQQLVDTTKRLMPRNRVDAVDMLEQFHSDTSLGMMEASDSLTSNYLAQRGLSEGWMTVNSDMLLMYNRKLAFDFDRNEYALKQASALDEAAEIERTTR